MYSAFEQALSMKRALYKFGIIIIIISGDLKQSNKWNNSTYVDANGTTFYHKDVLLIFHSLFQKLLPQHYSLFWV